MIQSMQWIAKTSTTSFPFGIVSIGPLLGEIQMATAKMGTKWVPGKEMVKTISFIEQKGMVSNHHFLMVFAPPYLL